MPTQSVYVGLPVEGRSKARFALFGLPRHVKRYGSMHKANLQEKHGMKVKRWQRIGVVVSIAWLAVISVSGASDWLDREERPSYFVRAYAPPFAEPPGSDAPSLVPTAQAQYKFRYVRLAAWLFLPVVLGWAVALLVAKLVASGFRQR